MKKNILILSSALLLSATTFMIGCKKDDTTAPVVTLTGSDVTILLQDSYVDAGATANDDEDGAITPVMSGVVDNGTIGVYTITYTATDAAGNEGTATRTVTVKNGSEAWEGSYKGWETDGVGPYTYAGNTDLTKTIKITVDKNKKYRLRMTRLGDFKNNSNYFDISGSTVDLPSQTSLGIGEGTGCAVSDHTFFGNGSKYPTTDSVGFTLTYTDNVLGSCSANSRATVNAKFTKKP